MKIFRMLAKLIFRKIQDSMKKMGLLSRFLQCIVTFILTKQKDKIYLVLDPRGELGGLAHQHVRLDGLIELVLSLASQAQEVVVLTLDLRTKMVLLQWRYYGGIDYRDRARCCLCHLVSRIRNFMVKITWYWRFCSATNSSCTFLFMSCRHNYWL